MTTMKNTATDARQNFDGLKRAWETAHATGNDNGAELMELSAAIARSVIRKCVDPQRKAAADRETVSDSGYNPAMMQLRTGITADLATLDKTRRAAAAATRVTYNADGDMLTETADADAERALNVLVTESLSDGVDLVQTAALALLEQAADHAGASGWLDAPYTVRRLSRRVYVRSEDSAAYRDEETTPMREAYRAVRRAVQDSRAVQIDPRNGYTYLEDCADGLEAIYIRLHKYADLGGYDCDGRYTADRQTVEDYYEIVKRLNLTDRQAVIVRMRTQGHGNKAIASYLGVTYQAVQNTLTKIQKKAREIGLNPDGFTE